MDTGLGPGIIAVEAKLAEPFKVTVDIPSGGVGASEHTQTKALYIGARREQLPMTITAASTLYTLQGTTATPGLIYHFKHHGDLSAPMKWIATHIALSRVRRLREFRSIGISDDIRDIINRGPPEGP